MSEPEVHVVHGTTFRFPELPPRDEVDPALWDRLRAGRDALLAEAARPGRKTCKAGTGDGPHRPGHTCRDPHGCRLATMTRRGRLRLGRAS